MGYLTGQIEHWAQVVIDNLPRLLLVCVLLLLTIVLARWAYLAVQRVLRRTPLPPDVCGLFSGVARVAVLVGGVLLVLQVLGLGPAVYSFVASLGIAGLIVGFALQDIIKQFASGVLLLLGQPFRAGDRVRVGAFEGAIVEIQLRVTVLKTDEGDEVLIPNADIYSTAIINRSRSSYTRRVISLVLKPNADEADARERLARAVADVPGVVSTPPPAVIATGVSEKGLAIEVRYWIDYRAYNVDAVTSAALLAAQDALPEAATV